MKVTFRIDDVSLYMNWEIFNDLIELFNKKKIKPLLGLIPDNQDPELRKYPYNTNGWNEIAELVKNGWMVSQHGYQHIYSTEDSGLLRINKYSEFAGVDFSKQYAMISQGKKLLAQRGFHSDIFMAPAHSYDENTILALKQLGFRYVTDGYSLFPYERHSLKFIPCQSSRPIKGLFGIQTICLHPNTMSRSDLDTINRWITENTHKIYDYSYALKYPNFGTVSKIIEKLVLGFRYAKKAVR